MRVCARRDKAARLLLRLCFCWMTFFDQPALSQPPAPTDSIMVAYKRLLDIGKRIIAIEKDLLLLSDTRDPEWNTISELRSSSNITMVHLAYARDVLWLYRSMSSARDRENVRKHVDGTLKEQVGYLENQLLASNAAATFTSRPEIVSTATQLKNAIRESIDVLNAVQL